MKENTTKAFELAQQEVQDKEVSKLKEIILKLLEKKKKADNDKRELEKEIKVIKQTIDDFKEGRLDRIKELLEKDSTAKQIIPINITIIQNDIYRQYPLQPWRWYYDVVWQPYYGSVTTYAGSNNTLLCQANFQNGSAGIANAYYTSNAVAGDGNMNCSSASLSGQTAQNFTGGTYNLSDGGIINL